jgi:hypothetical protein
METKAIHQISLRWLSFLLLLLMALGSFVNTTAQTTIVVADSNGNELTYSYDADNGPATFNGIKTYASDADKAGRIIIADEVTDANGVSHEVKYISGYVNNRSNIVSIVFGQNITCVGGRQGNSNDAFRACQKLESVTLNSKLDTLGSYSFYYCTALKNIDFSKATNLKVIKSYAFSNIDSLRTITLPKGIVSMESYVFSGCDSLRTVTFDDESVIAAIPNYCFGYCYNLQTVTLPNSVQTIGSSAFQGCNKLREITFGTGLATNGFANDYYLFYNCSNMEKMTIPGVNFPFQCSMYDLPNTMILYVHPDMVETYKTSSYTKNYRIIAIGSTTEFNVVTTEGGQLATKVPAEVAVNALSLTVTGPINGTDINQIHELMPYLEDLNLKDARIVEGGEEYYRYTVSNHKPSRETNYHYATEENVIGQYMFYNMPNLKRLSLPDGVTARGNYAVSNPNTYSKLIQVDMPTALMSIGEYAFCYASKLVKADIPTNVTTIGKYAFYNNTVLKMQAIPNGVTRIEDYTFYNCDSLTTLTLPDDITYIGKYAFYDCDNLQTVNTPTQLETIGNSAFSGCIKLGDVTLPQGLTSLGTYTFYNCRALKQFTFPANIRQVPESVLYGCSSLKSVALADGTSQIGYGAFYGCNQLATVENLNQTTLTKIDGSAFYNTALVSVELPNTITSMGTSVFSGCTSLVSVNVPTGISSVPNNTFQGCAKLTNVTMHDGITSIGENAFANCRVLPTIELNDHITVISYYAFYNCESLVLTALPAALTSIGGYAFYNTKAMSVNLTIPETVTSLGYEAFYGSGITGIVILKPIEKFNGEVFYNCKNLATVSLPQEMTKIPNYTFYGTSALQTIIFPSALQEIGDYAFCGSALTEISLPKSLQVIGAYAFYNTQLAKIEVPKNVVSVGRYFVGGCKQLKEAFLGRKQDYTNNSNFDYFVGCDSLKLLRIYAGTPPAITTSSIWTGNGWGYNAPYRTNCVLEVPEGQVDIYKATDIWKEFKEIRGFESSEMLNNADYAVLKDIYNNLDGTAWTKPWDVSKQNHSNGKWPGVKTEVAPENDELFYITDIDLNGRGLVGQLPKSVFGLSKLKTLNLSHNVIEAKVDTLIDSENTVLETLNMEGNHLKGDLYPFVSKLTNLTGLNVRYNWLTKISQAIPHDKLKDNAFQRGFQFVDYKTKEVNVPEELKEDVVVNLTLGTPVSLGSDISFQTYRHNYGDYNYTFSSMYRLYKLGSSLNTSSTEIYKNSNNLWDIGGSNTFHAPKGKLTVYSYGYQNYNYYDNSYDYITFIFNIDWKDGDVNVDQTVDVADLQSVVYYALNDGKPYNQMFNYTTADANSDSKINVSDIIGNVNYILDYEEPEVAPARNYNKVEADCRNLIMKIGSKVTLANADEVAALQLTISGVHQSQLQVAQNLRSRFTVSMRNVDGGVRLVVYSPLGNTLAPGESLLLNGLPANAVITDARLVDSNAAHLPVGFDSTTSIDELSSDDLRLQTTPVYDLSGRRVGDWNSLPAGIYIVKLNGKQFKVRK